MKARYRIIRGRRKNYPDSVEIEIYLADKSRMYISTTFKVPEKFWDNTRNTVKPSFPNATAIQQYLEEKKAQIEAEELKIIFDGRSMTKDDVKSILSQRPVNNVDIINIFNDYNDDMLRRKHIKELTHVRHKSEINQLKKFLAENNLSRQLYDFNVSMLQDFDTWLQNRVTASSIGTIHNTIHKLIKIALKEELIRKDPYKDFIVVKGHSKKREALTMEQLKTLEKFDRTLWNEVDPFVSLAIDKFLFSCYCGLRISDNTSLLKTEIRKEKEGYVLDKITEKQEGVHVVIPLRKLFDGKAEAIVDRYLKLYPDIPTLFPPVANKVVNDRLKIIQLHQKLPLHLTFHVARHTCGTILAELTGNPFVVMKILGHSNINTSMIYIHNSYSATVKALENVNWN